ncbi:MAG: T9SS type A sorting domain-containing protein [candidate division Zixibacteria bacterium]|nr:T9SS type A sorting domain-containing protein [candidate division Zixibacteria bacterium]
MKTKITIFLAIFFVFTTMALAQPYTGVITVETVDVHPGDHFGVKIRISGNNMAFSALTIPVSYQSDYLTLDSVSFAGSIKSSGFNGIIDINEVDKIATIAYLAPYDFNLPLETISAAEGIIAEMFFTLAAGTPPQTIVFNDFTEEEVIDYEGTEKTIQTGIYLVDNTGLVINTPAYVAGGAVVQMPTAVIEDDNSLLPNEFALAQNYPNPFNPSTRIEFSLPTAGQAKLEIFNILGQNVATLVNETLSAGNHEIEFDASNLPSGIYFYRLMHENGSATKKMVLVK